MDPIDRAYAPPGEPTGPPPPTDETPGRDPIGWALLALPVGGGLGQMFLPSTAGSVAGYAALLATVVLIGVDASRRRQRAAPHVWKAILLWLVFYPLYMHERAKWGAPRRLALALGVTLFFGASLVYRPLFADRTRILVSCKPAGTKLGDGFDCSLQHTSGTETAKACWTLALTCANGPGGSAHACGSVAPKQTATVRIEFASLAGASQCDKLSKIDVKDLVLDE